MTKITFKANPKQLECLRLLMEDKTTSEIGYGGGAGGGKTYLGVFWVFRQCMTYAGVKYFFGRKELKNLKKTTLASFFKMMTEFNIPQSEYYYNAQDSFIRFKNGSQILLLDLSYMPSDPLYLRLGGLELTGGFIDESNEIRFGCVDILHTRIGRHLNKENGIPPKILECFNPDKGHVYSRFYKPNRDDKMPEHRRFIRALATDNFHLPTTYIEQLKRADKVTRERLLYGNFEYDDDPSRLFEVDAIEDLFTNAGEEGERYISCDVARFGMDRTVIVVWRGLLAERIVSLSKKSTADVVQMLKSLSQKHSVRRSNIVIDEDGVGGGVVDHFSGCKGFVNNSSALEVNGVRPNYANLRTQCFFEFARLTELGKIGITTSEDIRELITEELEQIKQKDIDKSGKISLVGKEKIKEDLGRSPDFADALMMRMIFELKGNNDGSNYCEVDFA